MWVFYSVLAMAVYALVFLALVKLARSDGGIAMEDDGAVLSRADNITICIWPLVALCIATDNVSERVRKIFRGMFRVY